MATNMPVTRLFKLAYPKNYDQDIIDAYGAPFPSSLFKGGAARYINMTRF